MAGELDARALAKAAELNADAAEVLAEGAAAQREAARLLERVAPAEGELNHDAAKVDIAAGWQRAQEYEALAAGLAERRCCKRWIGHVGGPDKHTDRVDVRDGIPVGANLKEGSVYNFLQQNITALQRKEQTALYGQVHFRLPTLSPAFSNPSASAVCAPHP